MFSYVIFGSENSIDEDRCYFLTEPIKKDNKSYYQKLCDELSIDNINANVAFIANGVIHSCYKGTPDEVNNSILYTYDFHLDKQEYTMPLCKFVNRDIGLKILRSIRIILSFASRSQFRKEIKHALKSSSIEHKLLTLKKAYNNSWIFQHNNKIDPIEMKKTVAFQIGQTLALIEGIELYTKNSISEYDNRLKEFLDRKQDSKDLILCEMVEIFIHKIYSLIYESDDNYVRFLIPSKAYNEISTV